MLWKRESDKPNALFIDIFGMGGCERSDVEMLEDVYARFGLDTKCAHMATAYKDKGNVKFRENNMIGAIYSYNQSLCYAPIGSKEKSLAFANRATCYLRVEKYKRCLADIELAIKSGYPKESLPKLEKRRVDCLKLMKEADGNEDPTPPQLEFDADKNFPAMANVLKIVYNEKFGRHVIATSDIGTGKLVLLDTSYVQQIRSNEFYNCNNCLQRWTNLIPCDHCTTAMFCDEECMKKDAFHKSECQEMHLDDNALTQYFARSILRAIEVFPNVDNFMNFVLDAVTGDLTEIPPSLIDEKSKYRAFLKHRVSMPPEKNKRHHLDKTHELYRNLLRRKVIKEKFQTKAQQRFLMHLAIHHYFTTAYGSIATSMEISYIALSLMSMYFNHSCAPNMFIFHDANQAVGVTARPIKKGQQIFIPYLGKNEFQETARQRAFHNFTCECERCDPTKVVSRSNYFTNPLYRYLQHLLKVKDGKPDSQKNFVLRTVLIELLDKYGRDGWNENLDILVRHFQIALTEFFQ